MSDFAAEEAAVGCLDGWIEKLFECKPLTEVEVRQLCDKVGRYVCIWKEAEEVDRSLSSPIHR